MSPTLTQETRRRLALSLIERPVNRNRLRRHRRRHHTAFNLAACLVGCAVIATIVIIAGLARI